MTFELRRTVSRWAAGAAALALVSSLCLPPAGASAQTAPTTRPDYGPGEVVLPFPRNAWAQTYSDIAPDPAVRFGTLPNGMRYAIMKNATPSNQASLRMLFDAGSMMERDDQQGLAHFLEHMAFNGSKNVPEGDMIKILERLGLAFGADTNASTGADRTIYQLDLPRTDDETVDTSLKLFREAASELLIDQGAVDRERGVVLSEERARDTPDYRLYKGELAFLLGDHIAVKRQPIGLPDILRNAPASAIRDFYRDYYRPERTVLVAVGDFDVNVIEQKIKDRFGDWNAAGSAGPEAKLALPLRRGPEAKVMVEPGVQLKVAISWIAPPDLDADTTAERTESIVEGIGFAILNRRLERLARNGSPPFISAGGGAGDYYRSAKLTSLEATAQTGQWRQALIATVTEQRRIAEFGVSQAEIDRELAGLKTGYEAAVSRAATRTTVGLANAITGDADNDGVFTSPAQDLAMFTAAATQVTVDKVNAAMKAAFAGSGPLVFLSTPSAGEGDEAAVLATLNTALSAPVEAGADLAIKAWPYTNFGTPGAVAEQTDVLDLDTTLVRFQNGVRLTVKPTKFRDDQILISVRVGSGLQSFPSDKTPATWPAPSLLLEGGLGDDLSAEDIEQIMTSKVVGVDFNIGDDAFAFSGGTRPADLVMQMQYLTAYVTDPGLRREPFDRIKAVAATIHDQQDATADGVLGRELSGLLHNGDRRWAFPTREEIAATTYEDVRAILEPTLQNGPIEIVIVGDTTVEKAIAAVAETFGALPPRPGPAWTSPGPQIVRFPAPNAQPIVLTHKGRADQAEAVIGWKTNDFFAGPRKARATRLLGEIMNLRLIEELREKQGTTYSPSTSFSDSSVFTGYGFALATVETPPVNITPFFNTVEAIAADLRDNPVSDDELNRGRAPMVENLLRNLENNAFWVTQLTNAQTDPRRLPAFRTALSDLRTITAADIQAAAKEYLLPGQTWKLEVRAESAP